MSIVFIGPKGIRVKAFNVNLVFHPELNTEKDQMIWEFMFMKMVNEILRKPHYDPDSDVFVGQLAMKSCQLKSYLKDLKELAEVHYQHQLCMV